MGRFFFPPRLNNFTHSCKGANHISQKCSTSPTRALAVILSVSDQLTSEERAADPGTQMWLQIRQRY